VSSRNGEHSRIGLGWYVGSAWPPVLVALSPLASAATAHAECAWVSWQQHVANDGPGKISLPLAPLYGRDSGLRT
jgi:hypothetical protein